MTQVARLTNDPPAAAPASPRAVPAGVGACLARARDSESAAAATRALAHSHYENFSVVSSLLPQRLRQDFCNIYAFCRTADDLGDELGDQRASLHQLARLGQQTREMYAGGAESNLFVALHHTIRRHDIPIEPFLDLIDAFEQDQRVDRYESLDPLVDYCRRSANPVGRLVLYLCGYRDAERQALSDCTCTALQLANFWQDVRRDLLDRNRIYLPADSMARFGVTEAALHAGIQAGRCDDNYRAMIRFEVDRTAAMFAQGRALLPMLDGSVRRQVALFGEGGTAVLRAIRRQDYDSLTTRPTLSKGQKGRLLIKVAAGAAASWAADLFRGARPGGGGG